MGFHYVFTFYRTSLIYKNKTAVGNAILANSVLAHVVARMNMNRFYCAVVECIYGVHICI